MSAVLKRMASVFLCCVLLFVTIASTPGPLVPTARAAYIAIGTDNYYTLAVKKTYDPYSPTDFLLFSTEHINGWDASLSSYPNETFLTSGGASAGAPGSDNNCHFYYNNGQGKGAGTPKGYNVVKKSADISPSGAGGVATSDQLSVLNYFGADKMLGIWTADSSNTQDGSDGWTYWYDLKIIFNHPIDFTKFTHIYFEFWVSKYYEAGRPGQLNIAFWSPGSGSERDGYEVDIDFTKLKRDSNGDPCTGHRYQIDLRDWGATSSNGDSHQKTSIGGITFRYMCKTTDKSKYTDGHAPLIYYGKMIAHTKSFQPPYMADDSLKIH